MPETVTDVPLTDRQRLQTARCIHMVREILLGADYPIDVIENLSILKATFLGADLELDGEDTL